MVYYMFISVIFSSVTAGVSGDGGESDELLGFSS
jgi:hypothetical protein